MNKTTIIIIFFIYLIISFFLPIQCNAKDRCQEYLPDIRAYSIQYNGFAFPWWYNVGCAMVESNCRGNITSFDAGQGIYQFTTSTGITEQIRKVMPLDPYNPTSSIRAQSYYIMTIRQKFKQKVIIVGKSKNKGYPSKFVEKCGLNLADIYRFYNGGYWFFYESERGGTVCDNKEMKSFCVRGGTYTDKAKTKWLSFCDVNYSYPEKIYKYAQVYRTGPDKQRFWYEQPNVKK